jgi:hypothetical protein
MPKIIKIQHIENRLEYALIYTLLDDGTEAVCYVGGAVEVFLHKGVIKAFVKRGVKIK